MFIPLNLFQHDTRPARAPFLSNPLRSLFPFSKFRSCHKRKSKPLVRKATQPGPSTAPTKRRIPTPRKRVRVPGARPSLRRSQVILKSLSSVGGSSGPSLASFPHPIPAFRDKPKPKSRPIRRQQTGISQDSGPELATFLHPIPCFRDKPKAKQEPSLPASGAGIRDINEQIEDLFGSVPASALDAEQKIFLKQMKELNLQHAKMEYFYPELERNSEILAKNALEVQDFIKEMNEHDEIAQKLRAQDEQERARKEADGQQRQRKEAEERKIKDFERRRAYGVHIERIASFKARQAEEAYREAAARKKKQEEMDAETSAAEYARELRQMHENRRVANETSPRRPDHKRFPTPAQKEENERRAYETLRAREEAEARRTLEEAESLKMRALFAEREAAHRQAELLRKQQLEADMRAYAQRRAEVERALQEAIRLEEERLLALQQEQFRQEQQQQEAEILERFRLYDAKWEFLKSGAPNLPPLSFNQLPWPLPYDVQCVGQFADDAVRFFLFHPFRPGYEGKTEKERLKMEMLKWHPDKFEGKILPLVAESERAAVSEAAGLISRFLNMLKG